ncbi:MAG: type II toxin-antitoxin system VapC family toxin [Candidatus Thiosymbion ectosymbiont of Robbea hypermnestra]|nr:type II toxin-antitoxin system VapC family toxin [Candidatus Thiosymbion ectosymbiont of Robbea hypermnestra]
MRYLLDTNICIYIAKHHPPEVAGRFERLHPGEVGMSMITHGELLLGAEKSRYSAQVKERLQRFVKFVPVLTLPDKTPHYYARTRAQLERAGTPIGPNDLWIAAHALASGLTLVSNNLREFNRITELKTENWMH